jgi:hypothetical protein
LAAADATGTHRQPHITATEAIVAKLLGLARLSTAELQHQLNSTDGSDVFDLKVCAYSSSCAHYFWVFGLIECLQFTILPPPPFSNNNNNNNKRLSDSTGA